MPRNTPRNPYFSVVHEAPSAPTDRRKKIPSQSSHASSSTFPAGSTAPTLVGEMTREGLEANIARLTNDFRVASDNSFAASQHWLNRGQRELLKKQSVYERHMSEFGNSVLEHMRPGDAAARETTLASAHTQLDKALQSKPTLTEIDNIYKEMREQSFAGVMSNSSNNFALKPGSLLNRTYWQTGKLGESQRIENRSTKADYSGDRRTAGES